ncbi:tripartite tricarboxylate transporter TctB family protein [Desulfospira joergensenii]|uniref:tripartite tricarboxylate transporter TctB family protein n=1 Tax=Desulfospira joergensenii TaxID=53329 RepID=UPI0003B59626|nr:tripartite tricarboxylate transporter TctB family protein [Desulfospira joergensenii]
MNNELKLGTLLLASAGFLWFYAIPYHIKGFEQALFPRCLTISMLIPCMLLFIEGIKKHKTEGEKQTSSLISSASLKSLVIVPLTMIYVFLISIIGFYVTTSLFVFLFMLFFGARNWLSICIYSVTVPAIVYIVIRKILSFPFPEGFLF